MQQKMTIIGAQRRTGKANQGQGNDYDMASVFALSPMNERSSQHSRQTVAGFNELEYQLTPTEYPKLHGKKFPIEVDCTLETRRGQNGAELTITVINI
jgi:hypothetical protein